MMVQGKKMIEDDPLLLEYKYRLSKRRLDSWVGYAIPVGIIIVIVGAIIAAGLTLNTLTGASGF